MASPKETPKQKRVCLGKIVSPHGIKGLVKIFAYGDDTTLINGTLYTDKTSKKTLTISLKNPIGKYILAEIENCVSREQAESIKGTELWLNRDSLPEIKENEFYIEDLANLDILNEKQEKIGTVLAIQNFGAGDLIEVKPNAGQSYYIPLQHPSVQKVNLEKNFIIIENPERFILS